MQILNEMTGIIEIRASLCLNSKYSYRTPVISLVIETTNSIILFNKFFYADSSAFCQCLLYSDKQQVPSSFFILTEDDIDIKDLSRENILELVYVELIKRKLKC